MRDLLVVLLTVAFFAVCVAYVRWCDRIIGPDAPEPVAARHEQDVAR